MTSTKTAPGYPLPSGELGDDEIVCQLVYLPNRPEYWQAFFGALSYMTTWKAWERDDDKRGKDAAANWREAFEYTMECWRMTCLDDLKDNVAEILAIMQLGNSCCADQDYTDGDQYTDRVEDGEDDVPQPIIDAGYAEDAEDWEGFDDYKCMISHVLVDQMELRLRDLDGLLNEYGAVVGGLAAVAAVLTVAVSGGGLLIIAGMLTGIGVVSFLYSEIMSFGALDGLADGVADNHDALVCAIYRGDGDSASINSLNNKIDELFSEPEALILKNLNLGPTLKGLYAGRYDQQDIAETLFDAGYELDDFICPACEPIGEFQEFWDFAEDAGAWKFQPVAGWSSEDDGRITLHWNPDGICYYDVDDLRDRVGLNGQKVGGYVDIHRITFRYRHFVVEAGECRFAVAAQFSDDYPNSLVYTEVDEVFDPPLRAIHPSTVTYMTYLNGSVNALCIKDVMIDFDADV